MLVKASLETAKEMQTKQMKSREVILTFSLSNIFKLHVIYACHLRIVSYKIGKFS